MKELSKEKMQELEMEAEKLYPKNIKNGLIDYVKAINAKSAWLSCAKEYELKMMLFEETKLKCNDKIMEQAAEITRLKGLIEEYSIQQLQSEREKTKKLREAIQSIYERAIITIPYYAYGDNEAACELAGQLNHIRELIVHENLIEQTLKETE